MKGGWCIWGSGSGGVGFADAVRRIRWGYPRDEEMIGSQRVSMTSFVNKNLIGVVRIVHKRQ